MPKQSKQPLTEFTATVQQVISRESWGDWRIVIAWYEATSTNPTSNGNKQSKKIERTEVKLNGNDYTNDLTSGLTYRFLGRWTEHPTYGRQFQFNQFIQETPLQREGIVKYLKKYAPGIGPAIANRLFDQWGGNCIRVLRNCPEDAATIKGLTLEKAIEASLALKELQQFEETRVELNQLLSGRGFPHSLGELLIKKWGVHAPGVLRRDPFKLMVERFAGCGFNRCNRMYLDLGLPPERLKRQMLCLWHAMKSDMNGHTWFAVEYLKHALEKSLESTELKLIKALKLGVRSKWIAVRREGGSGENGKGRPWFAEKMKAENEGIIAGVVGRLLSVGESEDRQPEESEADETSHPANGHATPTIQEFFKGNATHQPEEKTKLDDQIESRPDVRFAKPKRLHHVEQMTGEIR